MPLGTEIVGRAIANRCRRGLYAKKQVQFGNRVSEDGGNRTKRKWLPNAHRKRLFSEQLGSFVSFQVTAAALRGLQGAAYRIMSLANHFRSIDKAGGLDNYVRKVEGTKEDSLGALEIRNRLAAKLGATQAASKSEESRPEGKGQHKKKQAMQLRVRQIEEARRKLSRAKQRTSDRTAVEWSEKDKSTLGWIRNKLGQGFKWT